MFRTTLKLVAAAIGTAALLSPVVLVIVVVGFVGAFFKGVFSFLTSKTKYMQTLSSSLYHKNLANNVSALTRLVDAADFHPIDDQVIGLGPDFSGIGPE